MKQRLVVFPRFGTASAVNVVLNDKPATATSTASPLRLSTAAAAEPHIHHLRDGEVVLYRRPRSRIWQCRYKQEQGGWARITTGKTSLDMATRVACEQYDEARFRQKLGLAPQQRTFASIAQATVAELQRDIAAGTGKKVYVDYCSVIERYLLPYFGERHLQSIKHADIAAFERWRNDKMGRAPKSSTLMTFASAFSRVHQTAVDRGWLSERVPVPKLNTRGEKGQARPAFSPAEIEQLRQFMATWQTQGRLRVDGLQRPLLCDYVEFLLLTGIRHGTESMGIEWRHTEWWDADGVRYLRVWVSGKTGPRWLIAKHEAVAVLRRLHGRQVDIAPKPFDAVLGKTALQVFRNEGGNTPRSFNGLFTKLMKDSGLRLNAQGQQRTLYSLRHTDATAELLAGTDIHRLAKLMGTSVLMLERHYSKLTATMAADKLA